MVSHHLWLNYYMQNSGVNIRIWSSVRLTVVRLSIVNWEAGGSVRSVNNSIGIANIC